MNRFTGRDRVDAAVRRLGPGASGVVADLGAVDALMETVRERRSAHSPARTEPTEGRGLPYTGNDLVVGGVRS